MRAPILFICAGAACLLPACSTPGGGTAGSYETLDSTSDRTSILGGTGLQSRNGGSFTLVKTEGTLDHGTGALTLDDGTYEVSDANGPNGSGEYTDGNATMTPSGLFSGEYDYVAVYDQRHTTGGDSYDSTHVVGIVTAAGDVPTSGTATYNGEAVGAVASGTQTVLLTGDSEVTANFGAGEVDVTMSGFTATNGSGATVTSPVDTISATGMTVSGNGFSGGTVTTSLGGADVELTGGNTTGSGSGTFYGFDPAISAPDEVGGVILMQGDTGVVAGAFVAD